MFFGHKIFVFLCLIFQDFCYICNEHPFLERKRMTNEHFKYNKYEKSYVIGNGGFLCRC